MLMLVLYGSCLIAADGDFMAPRNTDVGGNGGYGKGYSEQYRPVIIREGQPKMTNRPSDTQYKSTIVDRPDRDEMGRDQDGTVRFDPNQFRRDQAGRPIVVKRIAIIAPRDLEALQKLNRTFQMVRYETQVYPLLKKICDINAFTKLLSDTVEAQQYPKDFTKRMNDLVKMQKSLPDIQRLLRRENITQAMQTDLLNLVRSYKSALEILQHRDPATDVFIEVVARELPMRGVSNMLDTSMSQMSQMDFSMSPVDRDLATMMVIVGLANALAILFIALGAKKHIAALEDIGIGILVCEVVIGMAVTCGNNPNACAAVGALAAIAK